MKLISKQQLIDKINKEVPNTAMIALFSLVANEHLDWDEPIIIDVEEDAEFYNDCVPGITHIMEIT